VKLIPWRRVSSWTCNGCGRCCEQLKPVLSREEKEQLTEQFGEDVVSCEDGLFKLAKIGSRCYFQRYVDGRSFCLLQNTGLKPASCRTFPFIVSVEPLDEKDGKASLSFQGREIYVYANPRCPSLRTGEPDRQLAGRVIPEVVRIALSDREKQVHSTSSHPSLALPIPRI
jgi:hypothetical protein